MATPIPGVVPGRVTAVYGVQDVEDLAQMEFLLSK